METEIVITAMILTAIVLIMGSYLINKYRIQGQYYRLEEEKAQKEFERRKEWESFLIDNNEKRAKSQLSMQQLEEKIKYVESRMEGLKCDSKPKDEVYRFVLEELMKHNYPLSGADVSKQVEDLIQRINKITQ